MQSTEQSKSVRCDSIIVAARGIAEVHGKRVVLFVPADEIGRITLKFGRPEHRPVFSMGLGVILALVGVFGLIEFFRATRGYRYELGMMAFGVIGGSLIFDSLKERYFLEVEKRNGICRLVFSKNVKREEIGSFCSDARVFFNYQIQECA